MTKKSVFNKPMREAKPAKKIPVKVIKEKPKPVSEPDFVSLPIWDMREKGKKAVNRLSQIITDFRGATGEQDVCRSQVDSFLRCLDRAINELAAVFEP